MSEPKFKRGDLVEYQREEKMYQHVNGSLGIVLSSRGPDSEGTFSYAISWVSHKFTPMDVRFDLRNGWHEECFVKTGYIDIDETDIPAPLPDL